MGADGDTSAFAWYRAVVDVKAAGAARFQFSGRADDIVILVNGRRYGPRVPLAAGRNVIAVLASHRGRDKAFNYMGTLDNFARKGLFGPVQVTVGGENVDVTPWKMRGGVGPLDGKWQAGRGNGRHPRLLPRDLHDQDHSRSHPACHVEGPDPRHDVAQRAQPGALSGEDRGPGDVSARVLAQGRREPAGGLRRGGRSRSSRSSWKWKPLPAAR